MAETTDKLRKLAEKTARSIARKTRASDAMIKTANRAAGMRTTRKEK